MRSRRPDQVPDPARPTGLRFGPRQEVHRLLCDSVALDRQDTLSQRTEGGFLERHVVEERMDRRQTHVATARRTATVLFQMIEEADKQRRIQVLHGQRGRQAFSDPLSKGNQESERVPIVGDGMRTGVALVHQPLSEVGLQQFGEGGCVFIVLLSPRLQRSVASFNSSGTAERYQ